MKEFVHEMHLSHRIVSDGRQKSFAFIILQGQGENQRIDLIHNQIKIGRNRAKCQYVITNPQISGEHCEVTYDTENNQFYVKNYSRNYTYEEYQSLIKDNQTDKDGNLIYLYATHADEQYSYIDAAKNKGYNVLLMDGQLDVAMVSMLEQKFEKSRFTRVDSDVIDHLIAKEERKDASLLQRQIILP